MYYFTQVGSTTQEKTLNVDFDNCVLFTGDGRSANFKVFVNGTEITTERTLISDRRYIMNLGSINKGDVLKIVTTGVSATLPILLINAKDYELLS